MICVKFSVDGQGTKCRRNIAENFNRLSRVHERYRQTTDRRAIAYSERERSLKHTSVTDKQTMCSNHCGVPTYRRCLRQRAHV